METKIKILDKVKNRFEKSVSAVDENGLYFGDDLKTGKNIQIDLKALAAKHPMFVGHTGSGMSNDGLKFIMKKWRVRNEIN